MNAIHVCRDDEWSAALAVHAQAFAKHDATYHARPADQARQAARLREGVRMVAVVGGLGG